MAMNPETNQFEEIPEGQSIPAGYLGPFSIGELLPWKGYWFRIESIQPDRITLVPHGKSKNRKEVK